MPVDVKIPELGESITEAEIVRWLKQNGDSVKEDEPIAEIETDKATAELPAPASGVIELLAEEGATVKPGDVVARIAEGKGEEAQPETRSEPKREAAPKKEDTPEKEDAPERRAESKEQTGDSERPRSSPFSVERSESAKHTEAREVDEEDADDEPEPRRRATKEQPPESRPAPRALSPSVRRLVEERGLDPRAIRPSGPGGRLTKGDVLAHSESDRGTGTKDEKKEEGASRLSLVRSAPSPAAGREREKEEAGAEEERVRMSRLRRSIAQRLVEAQHTAAILTTFNEIDMRRVMDMRKRFKEQFSEIHGVSLGFMSFFARACILALREIPAVNAEIEGDEIVYHKRVHLGIAASTDRGLIVPVVHDADTMSMADLEREIGRLAELARTGKITPGDLAGGTFTISNGGVFGSLMSTPILNPPQSGILGMHKIEKRPVVVDDEIVVRPMMYVALSYDHRLIDGREAVTFLVRVKERIEDPERLLLEI